MTPEKRAKTRKDAELGWSCVASDTLKLLDALDAAEAERDSIRTLAQADGLLLDQVTNESDAALRENEQLRARCERLTAALKNTQYELNCVAGLRMFHVSGGGPQALRIHAALRDAREALAEPEADAKAESEK